VPTDAVKTAAEGREAEIVRAIGVRWDGRTHVTCPDPKHLDNNPSWRLMPDGKAVCSCRPPHSVFDVVGYVEGLDFEASKIRVAQIIGRDDLIVDPVGLTLAAYARIGKRRPSLLAEHMADASNEINFLSSSWSNRSPPNLWTVELVTVTLTQSTATYSVDASTVMILDAYLSFTSATPVNDRLIFPISRIVTRCLLTLSPC
jgi:hypothetical protein